jgi:glycine cleavage system H protein
MKYDQTAKYTKTHEWARKEGGDFACGLSDHAQAALGDIVYVDLPSAGKHYKKGTAFGVVESVKAANDIYMPMSGTVTATNAELENHPDLVNKECYGKGWMIRFTADDPTEWDGLLRPEDYETTLRKER